MRSNQPTSLAAGIDIGGTKMAVALVDANERSSGGGFLPNPSQVGFDRAVDALRQRFVPAGGSRPGGSGCGIGIRCRRPSQLPEAGLINNPYTLRGWDRCNIVQPLAERFTVPVYLENDADAAGFGECAQGAGRGHDPVVVLTFGTGIGGAAVVGGAIYRGAHGEHPELGHTPVHPDGPACYCGTNGCLESIASGTAIANAGKAHGFEDAQAVFHASKAGVPAAEAIIRGAVNAACTAAWTICHTFLPQRLVLGGGIMDEHFDLFATAMRQRLARATQFTSTAVTIAKAVLGNDAGVVGAANIALRQRGNS
ncbi:MAG: ROK family protein [Verrucomicrobiota bacterium]